MMNHTSYEPPPPPPAANSNSVNIPSAPAPQIVKKSGFSIPKINLSKRTRIIASIVTVFVIAAGTITGIFLSRQRVIEPEAGWSSNINDSLSITQDMIDACTAKLPGQAHIVVKKNKCACAWNGAEWNCNNNSNPGESGCLDGSPYVRVDSPGSFGYDTAFCGLQQIDAACVNSAGTGGGENLGYISFNSINTSMCNGSTPTPSNTPPPGITPQGAKCGWACGDSSVPPGAQCDSQTSCINGKCYAPPPVCSATGNCVVSMNININSNGDLVAFWTRGGWATMKYKIVVTEQTLDGAFSRQLFDSGGPCDTGESGCNGGFSNTDPQTITFDKTQHNIRGGYKYVLEVDSGDGPDGSRPNCDAQTTSVINTLPTPTPPSACVGQGVVQGRFWEGAQTLPECTNYTTQTDYSVCRVPSSCQGSMSCAFPGSTIIKCTAAPQLGTLAILNSGSPNDVTLNASQCNEGGPFFSTTVASDTVHTLKIKHINNSFGYTWACSDYVGGSNCLDGASGVLDVNNPPRFKIDSNKGGANCNVVNLHFYHGPTPTLIPGQAQCQLITLVSITRNGTAIANPILSSIQRGDTVTVRGNAVFPTQMPTNQRLLQFNLLTNNVVTNSTVSPATCSGNSCTADYSFTVSSSAKFDINVAPVTPTPMPTVTPVP